MNLNQYNVNDRLLNYTQVNELYGNEFNLSPRSMFTTPGDFRYVFLDLEREKNIELGLAWPYPDIGPGECIMTDDLKTRYDLEVGDVSSLSFR